MAKVDQLIVGNEHTARHDKLMRGWQKRKDGSSYTEFWDYIKPELVYAAEPPAPGVPKPVVGVGLRTLCDKVLSSKNASDSGKGHKNCANCQQKLQETRAAAAAGTGSSAEPSASTAGSRAGSKRNAAVTEQLLVSVGGEEDVQLMAEITAAEAAPRKRQARMTGFVWNKNLQRDFDREWTAAAIADGDSFKSASLNSAKGGGNSAKGKCIQRFFGAALPDRKKMAGPCLDYAADQADGFSEAIIGYCGVLQLEDGVVKSIKWCSSDRRRAAVKLVLSLAGNMGLAAVADRVLSQHATVCAVDRAWSELGHMFPSNRSSLAVDKGNKMMLIKNSYRQQHNITKDDQEVEHAFRIEDLAANIDEAS